MPIQLTLHAIQRYRMRGKYTDEDNDFIASELVKLIKKSKPATDKKLLRFARRRRTKGTKYRIAHCDHIDADLLLIVKNGFLVTVLDGVTWSKLLDER